MQPDLNDSPGRPARILVVEDERHISGFLAYVLSDEGYEVAAAYDGEEALAVAATFAPDGVVLDLGLPKLSGQMVLQRLRADPRHRGVKILLLTGCLNLDGSTVTPQDIQADAQCMKPIAPSALLNLLKQHGLPPRMQAGGKASGV